jgi:hypothetical protein
LNHCKGLLIYVPGHVGVGGNERADRLASSATIADGQTMDRDAIANVLRELCRVVDFKGSESALLVRMIELGVKIGTARNEKYTRNRGLVNQHKTGTNSRWTLTYMLRGVSEHPWTCRSAIRITHNYNANTKRYKDDTKACACQSYDLFSQCLLAHAQGFYEHSVLCNICRSCPFQ